MTIDPFATPTTETQNENTNNTTPKENTVTQNNNTADKIVATIKGGSGFDAPWIVVHADTPAEANRLLMDQEMKELVENVNKVSKAFIQEVGPSSAPARGGGGNGKPAGAAAAPNGQTPPEGYVFKSGVSAKTGKPWKAFMPIDRNSGLEAIWL